MSIQTTLRAATGVALVLVGFLLGQLVREPVFAQDEADHSSWHRTATGRYLAAVERTDGPSEQWDNVLTWEVTEHWVYFLQELPQGKLASREYFMPRDRVRSVSFSAHREP